MNCSLWRPAAGIGYQNRVGDFANGTCVENTTLQSYDYLRYFVHWVFFYLKRVEQTKRHQGAGFDFRRWLAGLPVIHYYGPDDT